MSPPTTQSSSPTTHDSEKCEKLKKSIVIAVLVVAAIVGWHIYENIYSHGTPSSDEETLQQHEIHEFTQQLYSDEVKQQRTHPPYIAKVNFQGRVKWHENTDRAPQPLLQLNNELLSTDTSSTVYLLKRLYDNYELDTMAVEKVTAEEHQEEEDFLEGIMQTAVMQRTMKFLNQKGTVSTDYMEQMKLLRNIWFMQYSRGHGRVGSSGFEHVFLAELRNNTVLGLHNWLYFAEQEEQGLLDYRGWVDRIEFGNDNMYLISVNTIFHGVVKKSNSLMIGTSPELEISLYTICFVLSVGKPCRVHLGSAEFDINTYAWDWKGKKTLATAYPSTER